MFQKSSGPPGKTVEEGILMFAVPLPSVSSLRQQECRSAFVRAIAATAATSADTATQVQVASKL